MVDARPAVTVAATTLATGSLVWAPTAFADAPEIPPGAIEITKKDPDALREQRMAPPGTAPAAARRPLTPQVVLLPSAGRTDDGTCARSGSAG
ncbi:hypothetical protein R6L23_06465 [Streptomyces sp. SR27]|uniref:hypothetical protein n=1 Tax=Streptomyces sp. SR27 TaxID=3076630 RepID=UPI00295B82DE|nr:hypothetical protein [Streptomyces sp. SR27]MDV9187858.1 hypothetical protein [Streptomyces sp. SR27]